MTPELLRLLEDARNYRMSPEEKRLQAISFAYGNLKIDKLETTWVEIELAYDAMAEHQ